MSRARDHSAVQKDATLQRAAKAPAKKVDDTPSEGNLVRIQKADFVSLVGHPANQTGFKVLRSADATNQETTPMTKPVIRRTRRSEANPILALTFPEGTTEDEVQQVLIDYGMKDYTVETDGAVIRARRSDLQSIAKTGVMDIKLNDAGVMATVQRSEPEPAQPKAALTLASIEFDAEKFTEETANAWLQRNSIDSKVSEIENSDKALVVRRSAVPENEETRRIGLDEGVTGVIIRSDAYDIPDGYVAVINEAAYGNWGWGHLDFMATLADVAFTEQMSTGISRLEEVLRNILYWSSLPLDVRKTLTNNALSQFGVYVGALMDSLPRQLLVSVVRSAHPNLENSMTKANESGAATPATVAPATATAPAANADAPLTRADAAAMITDGIAAGLKAAGIQRAADPAAESTPATTPTATATATTTPAADTATLTRADIIAAVIDAMKPLADRISGLEGTTIVRSAPDAAVTPTPVGGKEATKDVFRGSISFPGRSRASA